MKKAPLIAIVLLIMAFPVSTIAAEAKSREIKEEEQRLSREIDVVIQRREKEEKEDRIFRSKKADEIDAAAKKLGYAGLNKKYGIGRFLYHAAKGGSLESGLNQVFWVRLSEAQERVDKNWKLYQVVDGWEIYRMGQWDGKKWVHLAITIKSDPDRSVVEGQRLEDELYVFKGSKRFISITGFPNMIQEFAPVSLDLNQ